ncbi:mfs general substrate transporter [Phaffia rhodozyma]|uniref:Mfs general substrate transporter n=1 Tax=Phaffia rhodozyma TaxID=264483 RepID=A0A0F7SQQ5_PHARH|nr:mfs general substrate transporter [Phaffia rhodozyma]
MGFFAKKQAPKVDERGVPIPLDYKSLSKSDTIFSFSLIASLFFLWGLSYGLVDVLNKHFLNIFGLTRVQSTLLQFSYFVSYLLVAPPMGFFMRKYGYKIGIHIGLGLFSLGTILYWPAAVYEKFGMFVGFTFITASGLATLEVAANSYITILGPPEHAAMRLVLAQAANGVSTVIGPLIAAQAFFKGENSASLSTVQYVYLALCCVGIALNIGIYFAKLPEITQILDGDANEKTGSFWQQHRLVWGVVAQFFYVGAQVAVASFTVFYITEIRGISPRIDDSTASNMFSGCQAVFTVGRFAGVLYLRYFDPAFALFVSGTMLVLFSVLVSTLPAYGGIACLYIVFFFESICYPVIFTIATADLGPWFKIGSGCIAAAVSGGAAFPAMQGAVADYSSTSTSFFIPMTGFIVVMCYGFLMWRSRSRKYGQPWSVWVVSDSQLTNPEGRFSPAFDDEKGEDIKREHAEIEVASK